MKFHPSSTLLLASLMTMQQAAADGHIPCLGACSTNGISGNKECVFTTMLDLFAGELGYFKFAECGDEPNPTLGKYLEKDRVCSNWDIIIAVDCAAYLKFHLRSSL